MSPILGTNVTGSILINPSGDMQSNEAVIDGLTSN